MTGLEPLVSIYIRGWKRPKQLRQAIASVLAQDVSDLEVVVADDWGQLEPVVAGFGDPRVRYHRNPRRLGSTENGRHALNLGRGRFLGVLGDDDRLLPGYLSAVLATFEENPSLGVVFTNHLCEREGRF